MKYLIDLIKLNAIIVVLALLAACAMQASGAVKADRYKAAIARELTQKLRVDLADQTVRVKLSSVRENGQIGIDGQALAVVTRDKTELPLQFTAKVNLSNQNIEDVSYQFVAAAAAADAEFAPSLAEDNLMKELMAKISRDYETTNIVISIDGFETAPITSLQTKYEGIGEVRIGDFEWRKIKFNVVLDSQSKTATKILYDVQK